VRRRADLPRWPSEDDAAEIDSVDGQGCTSLHLAAYEGHERICAVLLQAGASLAVRALAGHTPLLLAHQEHPTKTSLLALLSGAGPSIRRAQSAIAAARRPSRLACAL
jgi:ankyrin repeat protein